MWGGTDAMAQSKATALSHRLRGQRPARLPGRAKRPSANSQERRTLPQKHFRCWTVANSQHFGWRRILKRPASRSWMAVRSCGRRRARLDNLAFCTTLQTMPAAPARSFPCGPSLLMKNICHKAGSRNSLSNSPCGLLTSRPDHIKMSAVRVCL